MSRSHPRVSSQRTHLGRASRQEGWDWPHLCLGEAKLRGQLGPLGQSQVLRVLETLVQALQLQTRIDGPRLPELLGRGLRAPLRGLRGQRRLLGVWGAARDDVCTHRGADAPSHGSSASRLHSGHGLAKTRAWGSALLYLPLHPPFKPHTSTVCHVGLAAVLALRELPLLTLMCP